MEKNTFVRSSLVLMALLACPLSQAMEPQATSTALIPRPAQGSSALTKATAAGSFFIHKLVGDAAWHVAKQAASYCYQEVAKHPYVAVATTACIVLSGGWLLYKRRSGTTKAIQAPETGTADAETLTNPLTPEQQKYLTAQQRSLQEALEISQKNAAQIMSCFTHDIAALEDCVKKLQQVETITKASMGKFTQQLATATTDYSRAINNFESALLSLHINNKEYLKIIKKYQTDLAIITSKLSAAPLEKTITSSELIQEIINLKTTYKKELTDLLTTMASILEKQLHKVKEMLDQSNVTQQAKPQSQPATTKSSPNEQQTSAKQEVVKPAQPKTVKSAVAIEVSDGDKAVEEAKPWFSTRCWWRSLFGSSH